MAQPNKKRDYTLVEMEEKKGKDRGEVKIRPGQQSEPTALEKPFDREFWSKVQQKFDGEQLSWNEAMDEVRTERLVETHQDNVLLVMLRDWPLNKEYSDEPEMMAGLERQISRFAQIILKKDKAKAEPVFKYFQVDEDEDPLQPSLLHIAAKQNFLYVSKQLVEHYPGLLYMKTEEDDDGRSFLPVELALMNFRDETSAYLISQMRHGRVHDLFLSKDGQTPAKFSFKDYICKQDPQTGDPAMKKTVLAVLDRLINPHCPFLPEKKMKYDNDEEQRGIERAWSSLPDDPRKYHFYYHILDADENGRLPKNGDEVNERFNARSWSCLRHIANSKNKEAVQHPVIRMLVMRKWKTFAHWWFRLQAVIYLLFLVMLSFALIYGSSREEPMKYRGGADRLRLFCEILSVIFLWFYAFEEINQAEREGWSYFKDPYNYFDWLGLVLTFFVLPLRVLNRKEQWVVAAIGFLFNFLRLFKFSCVTRTTGLYTKTLAKIIYHDITRFAVVFCVVFVGFCGALYMSLRATDSQDLFSGFQWVMLAGIRALAEQQPVDEDYSKFNWLSILLIVAYMGMVVVVLLNILIAQLSYTYAEAKKTAKLQYAVDRMFIVSRLESSRFARFNLRIKHYQKGDWINEAKLANEILEYSEERHPWESAEEKLDMIREMMRKIMRRTVSA